MKTWMIFHVAYFFHFPTNQLSKTDRTMTSSIAISCPTRLWAFKDSRKKNYPENRQNAGRKGRGRKVLQIRLEQHWKVKEKNWRRKTRRRIVQMAVNRQPDDERRLGTARQGSSALKTRHTTAVSWTRSDTQVYVSLVAVELRRQNAAYDKDYDGKHRQMLKAI